MIPRRTSGAAVGVWILEICLFLGLEECKGIPDLPKLLAESCYGRHAGECEAPSRDVLLCPCGRQPIEHNRIKSGTPAPFGAYPWVARLRWTRDSDGDVYEFSGSVINSRYLLTTAQAINHYWPDEGYNLTAVILGARDIFKSRECVEFPFGGRQCFGHLVVGVEARIPHPEDDGDYSNDIGLLRLNATVDFNDRSVLVEPVCIPGANDASLFDNRGIITGWRKWYKWGELKEGEIRKNLILTLPVRIFETERCIQDDVRFSTSRNWTNSICGEVELEEGGKRVIIHDSGAPLVLPSADGRSFVLAGVWSRSVVHNKTQYAACVSVKRFRAWILKTAVP